MMKKILVCLVLFISCLSFAQEDEKLPEFPWKEIVELNNGKTRISSWKQDVKVKLSGNYSKEDSLVVGYILSKLNSFTETISIKFTRDNKYNLEIIVYEDFPSNPSRILQSEYSESANHEITSGKIFFYKRKDTKKNTLYNHLEHKIASSLVGSRFSTDFTRINKRSSIFNNFRKKEQKYNSINRGDITIIKEIYKPDFEKRLRIAEIKFIDIIYEEKARNRSNNIWWVRNPLAVIILPALLFILLSIYILNKINNFLVHKIENSRARFLILLFGIVFLAAVLIILCVSAFDFLTIPDDYGKVPLIRKDTILTTVIFSLFSMPFLLLMRTIELRIQKKVNSIVQKTALIFISTGFLPFLLMYFLLFFLANSNENNIQEGYTILANIFVFLMIAATLRTLVSYFYFKERKLITDNELKLSALRELKTKAELKSLQSQINPHFLYNSLNSIASLAPIDAEKTQKMAYSLSDLFKYSINRKGQKMSTVKDEIEMVQAYLEIEKIRFGDRLQFTIEVDETLLDHEIPLFVIQPLVENAIKHGVSKNKDKGEVVLKIEKETNAIIVTVSDNGPNFPEGLVSGHGLQTVYDLLRLNYGNNASLNWTNLPSKMITISISKNV